MSYATTTHLLTTGTQQATKLGFLSLPVPFPLSDPYRIRFSASASPPPYRFSTECSHSSPFCSHRGFPPPTDRHTGISKESPPILNSLPTHTCSTVPTPSTSPTLQESTDSRFPSLIVSTRQLHGNKGQQI